MNSIFSTGSPVVVMATRNVGKAAEFDRLLNRLFDVRTLPAGVDLPPETGRTFAENAAIKAFGAYNALDGTVGVLADDSGLEVAALGGRPGVRSARYAGAHASDRENVHRLLEELGSSSDRRARFVCALDMRMPIPGRPKSGPEIVVAEGYLEGEIVEEPRGAGGFGYDPVFRPVGWDRTLGEVTGGQKDAVSHRAAAVLALKDGLLTRGLVSPDRV